MPSFLYFFLQKFAKKSTKNDGNNRRKNMKIKGNFNYKTSNGFA